MDVLDAFADIEKANGLSGVKISKCYQYISQHCDAWWKENQNRFPEDERYREDVLLSEHIQPIDLVTRQALIDRYCPEHLRAPAKLQDSNQDSLVRLYLGKKRYQTVRIKPIMSVFGIRLSTLP